VLPSRLSSSIRLLASAWLLGVLPLGSAIGSPTQKPTPKFNIIALAEANSIHRPFVNAAKIWLQKQAAENNLSIEYIENTDKIDDAFLSRFQLFIQLDYPPYGWMPKAVAAFTRYIEEGRGGWIGFHHAALLGEFDGYQMWPWFSQFMGGIRFKDYIPKFATATVVVEDHRHPVMANIPPSFVVEQEEWYTYDKSPRPNVHVLAHVDEATYSPDTPTKMGGDHPVIWTNEHMKARNVYIFMGHHPELFQNSVFTTIFHNAILWAAHQ
jgi:type 1 glutamine amidotransferase